MGNNLGNKLDEENYFHSEYINELERKGKIRSRIVLVCVIIILVSMNVFMKNRSIDIGNPYNCIDCYNMKKACKKHKDIDLKSVREKRIKQIVYEYEPNKTKYSLNSDCDFCKKDKAECYSCERDREVVLSIIDRLYDNGIATSKLCEKDLKYGYAKCNNCRDSLLNDVLNEINSL